MEKESTQQNSEESRANQEKRELWGKLPIVHTQSYYFALWLFGGCVFLMIIWGIFGWVNETVYGGGIILHDGEYGSIYAQSDGILLSQDVERGDEVHMGQVVGRIFSDNDVEELLQLTHLLRYQESVFQKIAGRIEYIKKQQTDFSAEDIRRLDDSLARIKQQIFWYDDYLNNKVPKLESSGAVSKLHVAELRGAYDSRLREREELEAKRIEDKISLANTVFELENTLINYETSVSKVRFDVEQKIRSIRYRSRIVSYCNGTVANLNVRNGDMVTRGTKILRIATHGAPDEQVWSVRGYFSLTDAMKIRPGMKVGVTPSIVKAERDGSIVGIVATVSRVLETEESLDSFYQNDSFSDHIFKSCKDMPVEVIILLSCNKNNPSGFNWTSGKGPDVQIDQKMLCNIRVSIGHYSPLQLLLAKVRRFVGGDGVMEERTGISGSLHSSGE